MHPLATPMIHAETVPSLDANFVIMIGILPNERVKQRVIPPVQRKKMSSNPQ